MDGKSNWKASKRAEYMSKLMRNQVSTIFKARTRMITVKANYKNGHTNIKYRLCGNHDETQKHIFEECELLNNETLIITKEMIFNENIKALIQTEQWISQRMKKLDEVQNTSTRLTTTDDSVIGESAHE